MIKLDRVLSGDLCRLVVDQLKKDFKVLEVCVLPIFLSLIAYFVCVKYLLSGQCESLDLKWGTHYRIRDFGIEILVIFLT